MIFAFDKDRLYGDHKCGEENFIQLWVLWESTPEFSATS